MQVISKSTAEGVGMVSGFGQLSDDRRGQAGWLGLAGQVRRESAAFAPLQP